MGISSPHCRHRTPMGVHSPCPTPQCDFIALITSPLAFVSPDRGAIISRLSSLGTTAFPLIKLAALLWSFSSWVLSFSRWQDRRAPYSLGKDDERKAALTALSRCSAGKSQPHRRGAGAVRALQKPTEARPRGARDFLWRWPWIV